MIKVPDGTLRILVQGLERIRLERAAPGRAVPRRASSSELPDVVDETPEVEALMRNVQSLFARIIELVPYLPEELQLAAANVDDPSALAHLVASTLRASRPRRSRACSRRSTSSERLREISAILNRELEVFELGSKIQSQVQSEMEKGQREFFLRQQLKAIQEELGEGDEQQAEVDRAARADRGADAPGGGAQGRRRASSRGSRSCRRRRPSTASSAPTSTGS